MIRRFLKFGNQNKKKIFVLSGLAYTSNFVYDQIYCKRYRRIKGIEKLEKNFVIDFLGHKKETF